MGNLQAGPLIILHYYKYIYICVCVALYCKEEQLGNELGKILGNNRVNIGSQYNKWVHQANI